MFELSKPTVRRTELLLRSLLITAVSAFEVLLGALLANYFRLHPGLLDVKEKRFSLDELSHFASLEDARQRYIEQRVEEIVRDGHGSILTYFRSKDRLDIPVDELSIDWEDFVEILERRHTLVHHGGRVSQQYLSKVKPEELALGDPLRMTPKYVRDALTQILALGVLLATITRYRLSREREDSADQLNQHAYSALKSEKWTLAEHLAKHMTMVETDQKRNLMLQVNRWIARKERDGTEAIADEVRSWDTSACGPEFLMAQAALLDDQEAVAKYAQACLDSEVIDASQVNEWPLLRTFRESRAYQDLDLPPAEISEAQPPPDLATGSGEGGKHTFTFTFFAPSHAEEDDGSKD